MAADPVSQLLDAAGADVEMAPSSRDYLSPTKAVIRSALIPPSEPQSEDDYEDSFASPSASKPVTGREAIQDAVDEMYQAK